jgi:hypothetical protein
MKEKEIEVDQIEKEFSISFLFFYPDTTFFLFSSFWDCCLLYLVDERINNIWIWWWAHVSKAESGVTPTCLFDFIHFRWFSFPPLLFLGQKWNLWSHTHAIGHPPRSFTVTRTHSGFLVPFFFKYLFGFQCHKSPEWNDETEMEISSTRPSRRQKKHDFQKR